MKLRKLSFILLAATVLSTATPILGSYHVLADSVGQPSELAYTYDESDNVHIDLQESDFYKVELIAKLNAEWVLAENNYLSLAKDYETLKNEYQLSDSDIDILKIIQSNHNKSLFYAQYQPRVSVRDWHIYMTHDDVMQVANLIVGLGPAAIAATVSSFMSVVPGAGTIIGAAIGYFGAATIAGNFAYAAATGRGLKIGLTGISAI
jgi:hypothetical protein